ncbi:hypothetical protein M436DRAFT_81585 [Aureobasidium namibiae CBS 147.97]|uniref:Transmembrane protein n=1 Tax=Aureobasidium namibiae CBS 147.97 TaxID=1043004 RepID=A0A074WNP8_9PEZI
MESPITETVVTLDTTITLHHKSVTRTSTAIVITISTESLTGTPSTSVPTFSAQATTTTVSEQLTEAKQDWKGIGIKAGVGAAVFCSSSWALASSSGAVTVVVAVVVVVVVARFADCLYGPLYP